MDCDVRCNKKLIRQLFRSGKAHWTIPAEQIPGIMPYRLTRKILLFLENFLRHKSRVNKHEEILLECTFNSEWQRMQIKSTTGMNELKMKRRWQSNSPASHNKSIIISLSYWFRPHMGTCQLKWLLSARELPSSVYSWYTGEWKGEGLVL